VVSPGPSAPEHAGISVELITRLAGRIPILGVCLGHQAIGQAFGGRVVRAQRVMHGKTSRIRHDGTGVFSGIENHFVATRYHSLAVERATLPECLKITAESDEGDVMGLRVKKEAIGEIAAAAQVMRELATPVEGADERHLVDTCGTGGDAAHTFNVSTCAAFVAAAAGAKVAKHMGRSVSSSSGSAEVLEALGAQINLTPAQTGQALEQIGLGFMFAPAHHAAMK